MTAKKRTRSRAGAFLLASALIALAHPVLAISDRELVRLIAIGQIEDARTLFSTQNPQEIDWLFFEGRVAKADGQLHRAIEIFRDILVRDPSYIAAQRELAHSLLLAQDYRASAHHFRYLLRNDPSVEQRRSYIIFLDEIDRLRPFSLSGRFSIISSSNINRGSSQDRFEPGVPDTPSFDITSKAEPGTGLELGITGRHLWRKANGYRWTLDWELSAREFSDSSHNSVTASTAVQYARLTEQARWAFGPFLRRAWSPNEDDERLDFGASISADQRLTARTTLFFSSSIEHRDYLSSDERDGMLHWVQVGVTRAIPVGMVSVGTRLIFNRPELEHQQYDGQSVFAHISRSWTGGLHGGLGLEIGQRNYKGEFPLAGTARDDTYLQITISAQHDAIRFGRFTPIARCTFGSTSSNVAFYDHDIEECTIGIVNRF